MTDEEPCDHCGDADGGSGASGRRPDAQLSMDAVLELLADRRRRELLERLFSQPSETTTIDELVEHLMDRESEARNERPARDSIEIKLLHVHLPKLADAGILEYDERSREVRYRANDRLEAWLERVREESGD